MHNRKQRKLLLVAIAYSEVVGEPTSLKYVVRRLGVVLPKALRREEVPALTREAKRAYFCERDQTIRPWLRAHEKLREKGLIFKPDEGPTHVTEEGWKFVTDLVQKECSVKAE